MSIDLHWDETAEEKKLRIDKILELNSQPPQVCVSCKELISPNQTAVTTKHGPYHGAPFSCIEGRDEEDIPWDQK